MNTVIFDMDGLLIDSEMISYQMYQDLLSRYGQRLSIEEYGKIYSGRTAVKNMEELIKQFHLPVTFEEVMRITMEIEMECFHRGVALKPGARELLRYLKTHGYKIILATSSTEERARIALQYQQIESDFDEMVFGYEVEHGKPAPDIFLKACEKAQEPVENCLVLEDSEAGIQAAHNAHIPVICVPDMKKPAEKFAALTVGVVASLQDVIPYLEKGL